MYVSGGSRSAKFAYIRRDAARIPSGKSNMRTEEPARQSLKQIYSCSFCKFVQETLGVENLGSVDERKYLFHLKQSHGVEP
jgi:hypothetical protein